MSIAAATAASYGFGTPVSTVVSAASGTGSITAPNNARFVTVEAIGAGGNGFGGATGARASGGGGQYAISNSLIAVVPNTTVVFYQVGAAAQDSWVNVGTNAAPATATVGCLAKAGTSASSGVAGVGNQVGSVGALFRTGGNGIAIGNQAGAGSASDAANTAGPGPTAGTNITGGAGGAANSPGGTPGGGGGSSNATGTNPAGGIGLVRITFS